MDLRYHSGKKQLGCELAEQMPGKASELDQSQATQHPMVNMLLLAPEACA